MIDHEETSGLFEDFVKVDSSVHDFESGKSVPVTKCNVKGRLRAHVAFWEVIHAPAFIFHCIKEGYKLPFFRDSFLRFVQEYPLGSSAC